MWQPRVARGRGARLLSETTRSASGRGVIDSGGIGRCSVFDFGDQRGADHGGVGESAKNGNVSWERNAESHSDGKLRHRACAAQQCG